MHSKEGKTKLKSGYKLLDFCAFGSDYIKIHARKIDKCCKNVFRFTLFYNPILALSFVTSYWIIGLYHAYFN